MQSISTIIVFLFIQIIDSEFICDDKTLQELDASMANIIMNGGGRKYPESRAQVQDFCSEISSSVRHIENYKNQCMRDLAKQLTSVVVYTMKKLFNDLCKKNSKRLNRLLAGAKCANALNGLKNSCNNKFIDALLGINSAEEKLKIPYVCCAYNKIENCDRENGRRLTACTEDRLEISIEFTQELSQNAINFLCGDYTSDSDKCQRLPPQPIKKRGQTRSKSFLLPLINILESLPDDV